MHFFSADEIFSELSEAIFKVLSRVGLKAPFHEFTAVSAHVGTAVFRAVATTCYVRAATVCTLHLDPAVVAYEKIVNLFLVLFGNAPSGVR